MGESEEAGTRTRRREGITADGAISAMDGMGVADLRRIISAAEGKIREKTEGEKNALIEEVRRRAEELGMTLEELVGRPSQPVRRGRGRVNKSDGGTVAVKYRHGDDTWTGRGRMPRWLSALEAEGRKREEFRVA
jgi:DNA-binding protein H-NS